MNLQQKIDKAFANLWRDLEKLRPAMREYEGLGKTLDHPGFEGLPPIKLNPNMPENEVWIETERQIVKIVNLKD